MLMLRTLSKSYANNWFNHWRQSDQNARKTRMSACCKTHSRNVNTAFKCSGKLAKKKKKYVQYPQFFFHKKFYTLPYDFWYKAVLSLCECNTGNHLLLYRSIQNYSLNRFKLVCQCVRFGFLYVQSRKVEIFWWNLVHKHVLACCVHFSTTSHILRHFEKSLYRITVGRCKKYNDEPCSP